MKNIGMVAFVGCMVLATILGSDWRVLAESKHAHDQVVVVESGQDPSEAAGLLGASGRLTFLRVHDVAIGWGGGNNALDVEVVIKLDTQPDRAFGFTLRNDVDSLAHGGMLDLLREAYKHDWVVAITYFDTPGGNNGRMVKVELSR